jgi:hypothetical protein
MDAKIKLKQNVKKKSLYNVLNVVILLLKNFILDNTIVLIVNFMQMVQKILNQLLLYLIINLYISIILLHNY